MPTTPAFTLIHVFVPNLLKLKGAATVVSALERKDKVFFDALWSQAYVTHDMKIETQARAPYRVGVFDLPAPKEIGEAYSVGVVVKQGEPQYARYFTLEHDYVLAKRAERTLLCERDGAKHTKHGDGPAVTGQFEVDAPAFVDAFMELIVPTRVVRR